MDPEGEGLMSPAKLSLSVDAIPQEKRAIYDKEPILAARDLRINFGRVVGLDGVNLDLYAGEVLAVIGDNGAGKSTLIKCLTGAYQHDSGQLYLNGQEVSFKRPQDAREAGIETVYQQLAVIPALDIASNLYLAREERRAGPLGSVLRMLDKKGMAKRRRRRPGTRHPDDPKHGSGRRDPLGWSAASSRSRSGCSVREQGGRAR